MNDLARSTEAAREAVIGTGFLQILLYISSIPSRVHSNGVLASQELLRVSCFLLLYLGKAVQSNLAQGAIQYGWTTEFSFAQIKELSLMQIDAKGTADLVDAIYKCSQSEQKRIIADIMTFLPSELWV